MTHFYSTLQLNQLVENTLLLTPTELSYAYKVEKSISIVLGDMLLTRYSGVIHDY